MPAALYPRTASKIEFATKQKLHLEGFEVKQHLLCGCCEERFNKFGESDILRLVAPKLAPNSNRFPLLKLLEDTKPAIESDGLMVCHADNVPIDTGKFAYFALSIVWRGSIAQWDLPSGEGVTTRIDLGAHQEPVRQFLVGDAHYPPDVAIIMTVCKDEFTRKGWGPPTRVPERDVVSFWFYGVVLQIWFGPGIPDNIRNNCCHTSDRKSIFVTDCESEIRASLQHLCWE